MQGCLRKSAFFTVISIDLEVSFQWVISKFMVAEMEKEGKTSKATESDFLLQWGNRKRPRYSKLNKDASLSNNNKSSDCLRKKKITSRATDKESPAPHPLPNRMDKSSASPMNSRKLFVTSPEKEDRYYTTRGSLGLDENGKVLGLDYPGPARDDKGSHAWPRLFLSLSSKEKEEDFMAMKGCKLPQRPKKRAKLLQKSLLLIMPGVWLSDLCQERYEVREKKTSKKRPRGLKAMGGIDGESE
ncbi:hypothetical protein DVH24_038001 [Malus domestica]|uniref:DUF1639 domain-containing protein n=2 Tax=Malus domestica TaxID=3750 RepID=A0A498K8W8_MALDO|nr:hypothetical protein DVH24_038001 [Malus domestica]